MIPNQTIWPCLPLAKLCDIKIGRTPDRANTEYWGPGYPWLSIADMQQGKYIVVTKETITQKAVDQCHCYQVQPGTLLMSFKLSIGKLGFARVAMYTNEAIAALIIRDQIQIVPNYLYYALQVIDLVSNTDRAVKGKTLNIEKLSLLPIPLPPLPEQERIASILEKADRLRRLHRQTLELSSTYLQTAFLEMFGDPVKNSKGWKQNPLDDICDLVRGSSPRPQGDPNYFVGPIPRLMIADITRDGIYVTPKIDSLTMEGAQKSRWMKAGSVVMAVSGLVGLPAILKVDACIHDGFVGFRNLDTEFLPDFFVYLLQTMRATSQSQAAGAIWQNLTTDQIKDWQIIHPPIDLQQKFTQIVHKYEHLRSQQREARRQAEHLFQTLLHQAFEGELEPKPALSLYAAEPENADDSQIISNLPDTIDGKIHQLSLPVE